MRLGLAGPPPEGGGYGVHRLAGTAERCFGGSRGLHPRVGLEAGEAIVSADSTHLELDGPHGLATGSNPVRHKAKSQYRLRDFTERGKDETLGMPDVQAGTAAPVIDVLHRVLWLLEHRPPKIPEFLNQAQPNLEQLRLVAQALARPALEGAQLADTSPSAEPSALAKLLASRNAMMEGRTVIRDREKGQGRLL